MRYHFKYVNPFDALAEWINHLRMVDEKLFYETALRRAIPSPRDIDEEIESLLLAVPLMRDTKYLIRFGIPPEEKRTIEEWSHYHDFSYMLSFLSRYTEKLPRGEELFSSSYFYSLTHDDAGSPQEFECLNTNAAETGFLILPMVKTINDPLDPAEIESEKPASGGNDSISPRKQWAFDRIRGIQGELAGIYYIDSSKMKCCDLQYRALHTVLQRFSFVENKKSLKIALCPVAHKDLLNTHSLYKMIDGQEIRCFTVDGLKNTEMVYNRLVATFLEAGSKRADILVFPEMLGDERFLAPEFFSNVEQIMRAQGYPMPMLTLLPTWWHDGKNELYVLDASGRVLCKQQKQFPYLYLDDVGDYYVEDLCDPERFIHVVHIPEVGRFAFPICRDYLEDEYLRLMLRELHVTFILCPSYSTSKTQFDLVAPCAEQYGCYTVWVNTCAAYYEQEKPPSHVGIVAGPQDAGEAIKLLSPECDGKCDSNRKSCVFCVGISMDRTSSIQWEHIFR